MEPLTIEENRTEYAEIKGGKTLYRVIFGTMEPRFMEENRTEYFKR